MAGAMEMRGSSFWVNYAAAVSNLDAPSANQPEECESKKPWNRNCDHAALSGTYNAMIVDNPHVGGHDLMKHGRDAGN